MAELLSHVLVAYAVCTAASWRLEWLTPQWVAVAMGGAILPDLNRVGLLVTEPTIEGLLGVPFGFDAIHTLGGALLLSAIGSHVFSRHRRRAFALLLAGALSHLVIDGLKVYADGAAGTWLYPFTWARHPTPNLYVSSDPTVLVVTGTIAFLVWLVNRSRAD